jgi:peroxiredoxin
MSAAEYQGGGQTTAQTHFQPPSALVVQMGPEMEGSTLRHMRDMANRPGWISRKFEAGTLAPDFRVPDTRDGHEVRLVDFRGRKPVVLVFGSFSCDVFCNQIDEVERLYRQYKNRAEFLFVHVDDAYHTIPGLQPAMADLPPTRANRAERTRRATAFLGLTFPTFIDRADGRIESAYDAWPKRMVLVDTDGRVALDAGRGFPDGWDLGKVEAWLKEQRN